MFPCLLRITGVFLIGKVVVYSLAISMDYNLGVYLFLGFIAPG